MHNTGDGSGLPFSLTLGTRQRELGTPTKVLALRPQLASKGLLVRAKPCRYRYRRCDHLGHIVGFACDPAVTALPSLQAAARAMHFPESAARRLSQEAVLRWG